MAAQCDCQTVKGCASLLATDARAAVMLQSDATLSVLLALQNKLPGTHAWLAVCMYCEVLLHCGTALCCHSVCYLVIWKGCLQTNPVFFCLQAALDNLRELICQQHHLPPIAAVHHLQTATATPEAETAVMSSVDQVQHTVAFMRAANLVSSQPCFVSNSILVGEKLMSSKSTALLTTLAFLA